MGRWVDFDNAYRTMDLTFMESVWWVFQATCMIKDLVYEGFKVMPFSMKLGTPLSNFEANLNYKEVDDPSLVVAFEVVGETDTYFLGLDDDSLDSAFQFSADGGPEIDYVKVQDRRRTSCMYLAEGAGGGEFQRRGGSRANV